MKPLAKSASELRELVFVAPDVETPVFEDFVSNYFERLARATSCRFDTMKYVWSTS